MQTCPKMTSTDEEEDLVTALILMFLMNLHANKSFIRTPILMCNHDIPFELQSGEPELNKNYISCLFFNGKIQNGVPGELLYISLPI